MSQVNCTSRTSESDWTTFVLLYELRFLANRSVFYWRLIRATLPFSGDRRILRPVIASPTKMIVVREYRPPDHGVAVLCKSRFALYEKKHAMRLRLQHYIACPTCIPLKLRAQIDKLAVCRWPKHLRMGAILHYLSISIIDDPPTTCKCA